jgi:hypothetical protein
MYTFIHVLYALIVKVNSDDSNRLELIVMKIMWILNCTNKILSSCKLATGPNIFNLLSKYGSPTNMN